MTLSTIGNIMLGTTDLQRAVEFYHGTLGLAVQSQTDQFAFFNTGSVTLTLSAPHAGLSTPVAGATEVVFAVDGVRETYAKLKERGVTFMNEPRNVTGDQWAANFRDPDGHLLSIFGPERQA